MPCDRWPTFAFSPETRRAALRRTLAAMVLAALLPAAGFAQKMQNRMAVLPFVPRGEATPAEADSFAAKITATLAETGAFHIVPRDTVRALLLQMDSTLVRNADLTCALQIGDMLQLESVLLGEIARIDRRFAVKLGLADIAESRSAREFTWTYSGSFARLLELSDAMLKEMCDSLGLAIALAPAMGTLTVATAQSGADVFLNGKWIGKTPLLRRDIPAGRHDIRIAKQGYFPRFGKVHLSEGQAVVYSAALKKARLLSIRSRPDSATVRINDKIVGHTPFVLPIPDGLSLALRVSVPNRPDWTKRVKMRGDRTFRIDFSRPRSKKWLWLGGGALATAGLSYYLLTRSDAHTGQYPAPGIPDPPGRPK